MVEIQAGNLDQIDQATFSFFAIGTITQVIQEGPKRTIVLNLLVQSKW